MEALCTPPQTLRRRQACYALQGPDAATELQMLAALKGLSPESLPLLPALLGAPLRPTQQDPATLWHSQQQLSAPGMQQRQPDDDMDAIEDFQGSMQPHAFRQPWNEERAGADIGADTKEHGDLSSQGGFGRGTLSLLSASQAQQASAVAQPICTSSPGTQGVSSAAAGSKEGEGPLEEGQASDESGGQKAVQPQAENAASIVQRFGLNEEQAEALLAMERWAASGASQVDHIASPNQERQTQTAAC